MTAAGGGAAHAGQPRPSRHAQPPGSWAAPALRAGDTLRWPFDEDEVTAAWDLAARAGLAPGTKVQARGLELPAWWWAGTGLVHDPGAAWMLELAGTEVGPIAGLSQAPLDIDALARQALEAATRLDVEAARRLEAARSDSLRDVDVPMGASVTQARHEELLAARMRLGPGKVASWTTVGAGAAPSEFQRLQEAVGDYHVVLAELDAGGRTVGIWAGEGTPSTGARVRPVLRRLLRQSGAWRYGMKFAPQ